MGQVYRARDTKRHRDVAIKVLLESFAKDADRLAGFEREAQVLYSDFDFSVVSGFSRTARSPPEGGHYMESKTGLALEGV